MCLSQDNEGPSPFEGGLQVVRDKNDFGWDRFVASLLALTTRIPERIRLKERVIFIQQHPFPYISPSVI